MFNILNRDEHFQEELWRISIDMVKDHLSPETLEKYSPTAPTEQLHAEGGDEGGSKCETTITEQQSSSGIAQAAGESKEETEVISSL